MTLSLSSLFKGALLCALCVHEAQIAQASDIHERSSFHQLCASGTADQIKAAVTKGADINSRDDGGGTCLIWAAAFNQNEESVRTILDAGAYIFATDNMGHNALSVSVSNKNINIRYMLSEHQAKSSTILKNKLETIAKQEQEKLESATKAKPQQVVSEPISAVVRKKAREYTDAIACDVKLDTEVLKLKDVPEFDSPYDSIDQPLYAVLWTGNIGCDGGNRSRTENILTFTVGYGPKDPSDLKVQLRNSSPDVSIWIPDAPAVLSSNENSIDIVGLAFKKGDPMCCPTQLVVHKLILGQSRVLENYKTWENGRTLVVGEAKDDGTFKSIPSFYLPQREGK